MQMNLTLKHMREKKRTRNTFGRGLDSIIYLAAFMSPFALVPQLIELYSTKNVTSLSLVTWVILFLGNCIWLMYGIYHREKPIVITNALLALFNGTIVIGILLYR